MRFLTLLVFLLGLLLLDSGLQGPDSLNYLILTRSLFFDGDLFLANELTLLGRPIFATPTGYPLDLHNFGVALFWLPFYGVGHLSMLLLARVAGGAPGALTGLESGYVLWLRVADALYGLLGLLLMHGALRRHFSSRAALWSTAAVTLGSPLLAYLGIFVPSSHALSFFLGALFLYAYLAPQRRPRLRWWLLGGIAGVALWVANTNVALLALPVIHFLTTRPSKGWLRQGLSFGAALTGAFLPQVALWWLFLGHPLQSPYSAQLDWREPHLQEMLLSSYHGLFFFSPLLLPATVGLLLLARRAPRLALAGALCVGVSLYIGSVNLAWWGGAAFGPRYLLVAVPFWALGLAALFDAARTPWQHHLLAGVSALCVSWSLLLLLLYASGAAELVRYYSVAEHLALVAALPHWITPIAVPDPLVLLLSPLWVVLFTALLWKRRRVMELLMQGLSRAGRVLPLVALLLAALLVLRTGQARDRCVERGCDHGWIRSTSDQWDLAATYFERALYHAKRGERDAARADMVRMQESYPANPEAERWRQEVERLLR